jgi:hypothetical protein
MSNWWKQASDLIRDEINGLVRDARSLSDWMQRPSFSRPSTGAAPILPPVSVSEWLAGFDEIDRKRQLKSYLKTVDEASRQDERESLLAAAKYTSPAVRVTGNGPRPADRTIRVNLELPLFDFSAPNVRGASVDVTIFTRTALSVGWQVALGAGGGHTGTFTLKEMAQFTANPGEVVRIFVPIPAIATRRYYVSLGVSGRYEFQPLSETGFDAISPIKE